MWSKRRFHNELLFLVLLGCLHWILHPLRGISFRRYLCIDLFGGINIGLATVPQASIPIRKYLYVERDETMKRVSSRHLALLIR
jgi:hypothetical protein